MRQLSSIKLAILLVLVFAMLPLPAMFPQIRSVKAATYSNLILNGDFSNGLLGWTAYKTTKVWGVRGEYPLFEVLKQNPGYSGGTAAPDTCFPSQRVGNPFLSIDVPFGANGYVEQPVFIPTSGGATLSLLSWGWEGTNTTLGFSGNVSAFVRIVDSNNIEHTLETFTPPPMFTPSGSASSTTAVCTGKVPVLKSYDLSTYSGQSVKLRLGAASGNCCGTNAFFDDVDLEAQGIALHCRPNVGLQVDPNACAIPNAVVGVSYSYYFPVTGGVPPYFFDSQYFCVSSCPPGLSLNEVGQIWGTPTQAGVFQLLLKVKDSGQGSLQNNASIPITLTVTPIITNIEPYLGVSPSGGPATGGTAVNITGVGLRNGVCYVDSGACVSTKSVRFGNHDVDSGSFHVMNDNWIKVDSTPENTVCSYIFFCNPDPGLANVTVVVTVCYASSGSCNDYPSGFSCPTPTTYIKDSPRCNQFNYTEKQQADCADAPSIGPFSTEVNFETPSDSPVAITLSGSISATPHMRMCAQIDNWKLKLFNFTSTVDVSASLKTTVSVSASKDNLGNPFPLSHPFQDPSKPLIIGPVVIIPTLTPVLMYDAKLEGDFTIGISHHSNITFGINYTEAQGQPKFTFPTMKCWDPDTAATFCTKPVLAASVSASVKVMVGVQFSLLIYDIAGPVITPDVYLRLDAGHSFTTSPENPNPSCDNVLEGEKAGSWAAICAGVEVRLGFQLNPWLSILHLVDGPTNWEAIEPLKVASFLLAGSVSISPSGLVSMEPGQSKQFSAAVAGSIPDNPPDSWLPTWSPTCGTLDHTSGMSVTYSAPSGPTTCTLVARKSIFGPLLDNLPCSKDYFDSLPCFSPNVTISTRQTAFDYSLSSSGTIIIHQGGSGSLTITATLTSGTAQSISLSCSGLPTGGSCSFNPASVSPTGSRVLTVSTSSSSPTGSFPVTVTGNPLGRTTTFTLMVNALSAPSAPQNPTATGQLGQILIQWQPPSDDGGSPVIWYVLYSGTSPSDLQVCGHTCANAITRTSYTDRSVDCQATYYYAVSAVNAMYLEGPQSTEVSASPFCAPTVSISPTKIDIGQSSALSTTTSFSGGGSGYLCQWLRKSPSDASYSNLGSSFSCNAGDLPTRSTGTLSATGTWSFELQVTDSRSPQQVATSSAVTVTVNPALAAPVISASPTTINSGQSSTLSTTTPFSGGTSPYTCQWLQKAPGASNYSNLGSSFSCNTGDLPTTSTGTLSSMEEWSFELQVTDIGNPAEIVTSNTATVTVTPPPSIAVVINPNSGRVTVDGTSITELTVYHWQPGSSHIIVADSIYSPNAGTRLTFVKWNDGNTSNPRIVVVAQPAVYSADWQTQFRLDVASQHSPSQESWKNQDESVAVSAPTTADDNGQGTRYKCAGWSGTGSVPTQGTECSVTFTISQPSNLTWTWRIQYLLTVTANPSSVHVPGVSSEPWWVDEGKQVTLSAPDVQGMTFEYWTVGSSRYPDGQRSITLSLENAETATANYSATPTPIWVYVAIASAILGVATTFMVFRRSRLKTR